MVHLQRTDHIYERIPGSVTVWNILSSEKSIRRKWTVWMVTNEDRSLAIVGYYRILNGVNQPYSRVRLQGLNPDMIYENVWNHTENYGDELMNYGLITSDVTAGEVPGNVTPCTDFESRIYMLKGKKVQEVR